MIVFFVLYANHFQNQILNTKLTVMKYSLISTKLITCNVIIGSSIVAYATVACTAPAAAL